MLKPAVQNKNPAVFQHCLYGFHERTAALMNTAAKQGCRTDPDNNMLVIDISHGFRATYFGARYWKC